MMEIKNRYKYDNKKIVFKIYGDWNSKHEMYGSSKTDHRGIKMVNWMIQNDIGRYGCGTQNRTTELPKIWTPLRQNFFRFQFRMI